MSLDDDQQYAENRDELLNRFRESLKKPMSERYFDEDDLVEIFDYAGDLNDDFLRMEVLMCGARYYPDSEQLLERRGIFYSQYSDEAREQFLLHTDPSGNPILEILTVRSNPPEDDKAKETLDAMLNRYESLTDEEVIQFIDLASSLDQWDWIRSNMDRLRKKAQYLNVLLYEVAIVAELAQDYAYGAQMMEELTEIEPFNSYFWMLLARLYAQANDQERAMSAIDYSLAINPDSAPSLLIKAKLLNSNEGSMKEIIKLCKRALELAPGDIDVLRFLSMVYQNAGVPEMAEKLLTEALDQVPETDNPDDRQRVFDIIPELILLQPKNIGRLLDRFFRASDENSHLMWASWAQQLSMQGHPEIAREIIKCFERNTGNKIPSLFGIEDAFTDKNFAEAINEVADYVNTIGSSEEFFPSLLAIHLMALAKTEGPEAAIRLAQQVSNEVDLNSFHSINSKLEYLGLQMLINDIKTRNNRHLSLKFWRDKYDPLNYWNTTE